MGSSSSQLTDESVEYNVPEATKKSPRATARANPIYIAAGPKPQQNGRILQTSGESTPPSKRNANKAAKSGEGQNCTSRHGRLLWSSLFVLFAALDLILLALLIKVSVDLARGGQTGRQSPPRLLEDAPFCLPCSQVYLTELEVLQNRFQVTQRMDVKNRTKLCCAETHDDLSTLIGNMYLSVHYNSDRAKGLVSLSNDTTEGSSKVQAHLLLSLDHSKAPPEVNGTHAVPLVSNLTVEAKEYDSHSVIFHNGTIRVVHQGHYYIYSHIPFKFRSSSSSDSLTQFVFRIRNGGELLLLENSVYPCVVSTESCEYSFVGGMFLLEKGDEISLRVSKFTCIEREKEMKFGVQRI